MLEQATFDGLLSMMQCSPTKESLNFVKRILEEVDTCTQEFYTQNDELTENRKEVAGSAAEYHSNWNYRLVNHQRYNEGQDNLDSLETALLTGEFFPALSTVLPHPFSENDFGMNGSAKDYGPCSKDYSQKNDGFTHGAVTVCCSCSNPIIYKGLKCYKKLKVPKQF